MSAFNFDNEKHLLQQVADGNDRAFRLLFYRYADLLGTYVFRLTGSRQITEEIVQDVFLKIWMSREVLALVENFHSYLYVVSRNQALNALRSQLRQQRRQKEWERATAESRLPTLPEEPVEYPAGLIDRAIRQLPPQQQKVWLLSRKDGFTHKQIALNMTLSPETVKKYMMYANQSIARFIRAHLPL